jgi:hypothetical protein
MKWLQPPLDHSCGGSNRCPSYQVQCQSPLNQKKGLAETNINYSSSDLKCCWFHQQKLITSPDKNRDDKIIFSQKINKYMILQNYSIFYVVWSCYGFAKIIATHCNSNKLVVILNTHLKQILTKICPNKYTLCELTYWGSLPLGWLLFSCFFLGV